MKPLKYLNAKNEYAVHAYNALKGNFCSRKCFDEFLESIDSPKRKDLFLRLTSSYRFLVKEGHMHFSNPKWCAGLEYINETFKFISIFSLIEASFAKNEYIDFYQYLKRKDSPVQYTREGQSQLDQLYRQYKGEYGSIQNAVKFFEAMDETCKEILAMKLKVKPRLQPKKPDDIRDWEHHLIGELAKRLYNMRSEFVHRADFVLTFNEGSSVSVRGSKVILNDLTIKELCMFFEHGLLIQFGYTGNLPHSESCTL